MIKNFKQHAPNDDQQIASVGDTIKIISMRGEPEYIGKQGTVQFIDGIGQLHGTWGSLAVIPEEDTFEIL